MTAPTLRGMARAGTSDISRHGSPAGGGHRTEWRQVKSSLGLANGKYSAQVIHFSCGTLANIIVIDVFGILKLLKIGDKVEFSHGVSWQKWNYIPQGEKINLRPMKSALRVQKTYLNTNVIHLK